MKVAELFELKYGINFELNSCELDSAGINFVGRTSENNGVVARVKMIKGKNPQDAGLLTCAGSGSVLSTFVQREPFYSGRDLYILKPKFEMKLEEKLFYCHCIKMNAYRYGYGRQANKTLKDIYLPELPDWLKPYNLDYSVIDTKIERKDLGLDIRGWKIFRLGEIFEITGTKTTKNLEEYGIGIYPYITTKATDNGVTGYYDYWTEKGGVLVIDSAVAGFCSYQEQNFSASDHIEKLSPKFKFNKYIGLFIVMLINKECFRYNYGIKFNQKRIKETYLKLPATAEGELDLAYMENYIKSLPYGDRI
jgi:hypothetical protein